MARNPRLSPAEQEVQDYLAQASAGQAGINPAAQTLARSTSNPQASRLGRRLVNQRLNQNAQNREDAASEAERQAKEAAKLQESTQREQEAAQRAEQARNVRAAAEAGVQTKTDVETGRRDVKRHPNGDLMWEVGPTGPVAPAGTSVTQWEGKDGSVIGSRGSSIMTGGDGAAGANTGETKAEFRQPIRDDRGKTRLVEPETKTDKGTGFKYASGTDKSTGLPTKTVVGVDADQRRANALGEQLQALDLRDNAVKQTQAQFLPKWKPIEDEYSRAKKERESVSKIAFEKRGNSWVKVNREDGTEAIASVEEADAWRKRKEQTEGDFKRAETAYMKDVETAGNLERNVKDIADQKLKLAEEKIRLDSGLPANDGGIAFTMAEAEFGPSPANQAASAAADEVIPPEEPKPITDSEALTKAFDGVAGIEGVTLEGTDVGYSWMMQDGLSIGRVDNRGKDTIIILKPEATNLQAHVAKAGSGTVPIYLADNRDRPSERENAEWATTVMQVATNAAANPMQGGDGGAAGISAMSNNEFGSPAYDRVRAIEDMGADQDSIIRRVKEGTLSVQMGEALMQEVWGDTLKAEDPAAPETFQKFLTGQSPAFQREWQEANRDRDPKKLDELRGEFISDWYAKNQHKPGVTFEQQQKLRGNREARSMGDTAEIMAKGLGGVVVDAAGSMGGMIGGTTMFIGLALASPFSDTANDLRKAQADVLGRGFVNFNRAIAGNFKKYATSEGKARLKSLSDSSFELKYLIENRHGMNPDEFRQKFHAAAAQVGKDALAVHQLNQEEGWAVEAADFDIEQDRALGTALLTYAETGDPAEWESFQSRLLMDKGSRQAEDLSREVTAGKGRLAAAFASGVNAPPQEMLIELLSTTLTFGAGKALGTGTKAALKGSFAAGTRLARLRRAVAGVADDFAKFGRFKDTLANPASKAKRLANKGIDVTKANTVEASGEAVEGGVAAMADPNTSIEDTLKQMGADFLGGFVLGPLIAAPGTISGIRQERGRKQTEIKSFADWYNRTNADTEGFTPLAPAEAESALAMLDPQQHTTLKGEHDAAVAEFKAATEELANSQAPGEVGVAGAVQKGFRESAASRVSRAMARAIETKAAVSNYVGGVVEASQSTKSMEAPARARILGLTKAATGRTDLLTGTERQAIAGLKTREGLPYFADVAGKTVFTAEGRAEVQTDHPLIGGLIATDESKALVEAATLSPAPTNEQNPQGQAGAPAAEEAPQAGEAAGQAAAGSGGGQTGAEAAVEPPLVAVAPVTPNPAALDAAEYEALRQTDPSLPDIPTVVSEARANGQPVSKSMERANRQAINAGIEEEQAAPPVANKPAPKDPQNIPPTPARTSQQAAEAAIARAEAVFPKLKGRFALDAAGEPLDSGGAYMLNGQIVINLRDTAADLDGYTGTAEQNARLDAVLEEESIHIAQLEAAAKQGETLATFYGKLHSEFTPEQLAAAENTYATTDEETKRKLNRPRTAWENLQPWQQAAETVRMLIQLRRANKVTELTKAFNRNVPARLIALLKSAVEFLREVVATGQVTAKIQDAIDTIEAMLKEFEGQLGTEEENAPNAPAATPALRIIGEAITAAKARDSRLTPERALELEFAIEDLDAVLETMPAEDRRPFIDAAINEWLDSLVIEEKAAAEEAATPETKEKKQRKNPYRAKAIQIIGSGDYDVIYRLSELGKLQRNPPVIGLILNRKRNAKKLTEREMASMRSKKDGMPTQAMFQGYGPKGKLAAEVLSILTVPYGQGETADTLATSLEQGWTEQDLFAALTEELMQITRGERSKNEQFDPNRTWTDEEIEADLARIAEMDSQADPEREAMDNEAELAYVGPEVDEDGEILFSSPAPTPVFYSQLERAIEAKMPNAAPIAQVVAIATSGAKAEEVKWSGLVQAAQRLAAENGGKVPKDALLEHLRNEGRVRFEEVALRDNNRDDIPAAYLRERQEELLRERAQEAADENDTDIEDEYDSLVRDASELSQAIEQAREEWFDANPSKPTKFSQYTLPGGENYREVVLAMPTDRSVDGEARSMARGDGMDFDTLDPEIQERLRTVARARIEESRVKGSYTSSHFPDVPNYVAHMRLNDRVDAAGKPGLFIEELQSDRHQAGREKGYIGDANPLAEFRQRMTEKYGAAYGERLTTEEQIESDRLASEWEQRGNAVADAPFRRDWPLQMFKRALADAVAGGKEWIGWTVGATQNDRFDLSKQIDRLWITKEAADSPWVNLVAVDKRSGSPGIDRTIKEEELPDYIGKETAQKLMDMPWGRDKERYGRAMVKRLDNQDLRIGGSGMKGFYDTILPKEIGKYVRQWGGTVQAGTIADADALETESFADFMARTGLSDTEARPRYMQERRRVTPAGIPIHRIDITPAMKAGVESGQALFSSRANGGQNFFDFGATGSFDTKKQLGLDFNAPAAPKEEAKPITAGQLAGPKLDDEWHAFNPASGTLGFPRAEMPQVKADDRSALVQFLRARGVEYETQDVLPGSLKPTQAEYSPKKVTKARTYEGGNRSILVSSDNHIVDGHHQWMVALADSPKERMQVIRLKAPIRELLPMVLEMPSATTAQAKPSPAPAPEARTDEMHDLQMINAVTGEWRTIQRFPSKEKAEAARPKGSGWQVIPTEAPSAETAKPAASPAPAAKPAPARKPKNFTDDLFSWAADAPSNIIDTTPETADSEQNDDLPLSTNLERDRPDSGGQDAGRATQLPVQPGATGGTGRRMDGGGDRGGDSAQGGAVRPGVSAAAGRGGSGAGVSRPASEPRGSDPGNADAGGRGGNDGSGSPTDTRGASQPSLDLVLTGGSGPLAPSSTRSAEGSPLTPDQQGDVEFVERRLLENGKPGVLLTNGTGTGKTFSGLGAIKNALDRGAKHVLVIAPSDKVCGDWKATAAEFFGIDDAYQLGGITENGTGNRVVITTYANFGQNPSLVARPWDMIVTDEAHYLGQSKQGNETNAIATLRALTWHKDGSYRRTQMLLPAVWGRQKALSRRKQLAETLIPDMRKELSLAERGSASKSKKKPRKLDEIREDLAKLQKELQGIPADLPNEKDRLNDLIIQKQKEMDPQFAAMQEADRPKTLMLSATPFAWHFSLDYAEGFLFDHGPEPTSSGYNTPSARDAFFIENFGYRMRTGKLTQPDAAASTATSILERRLAEKLMREGAMRGRALEVPQDYSRQFVLTPSLLGERLDAVMRLLQNEKQFQPLQEFIGLGNYLARRYLLEGLKSREAVARIQQHLDLGRKVVVFHDYKKGGAMNPLSVTFSPKQTKITTDGSGNRIEINLGMLFERFKAQIPGYDELKAELDGLLSPIDLFMRERPDAGIFNGSVAKGRRRELVNEFNRSGSGLDVLLVQRASGKEGISLHDRDAKHQRAFIDIGLANRPTDSIQGEGRIYRHGVKSNAVIEYLSTGTDFERMTFAQTIAQRSSTAENLAMGERARALLQAFATGYEGAEVAAPNREQGTGGKELDRQRDEGASYKTAVALWFTNQKKTSRNKSQEGTDYFATPEPVGFKMVEWADIAAGEKVLEPSAGHGAIARFFPDSTNRHAIEPSMELASRLALNATDTIIHHDRFENFNAVNKFNAVVMNPPFGTAGKTAMEHLAKAVKHLRIGGRVVALIPEGSSMENRFNKWYQEQGTINGRPDPAGVVYLSAEIKLPSVTFSRAGTSVSTRIVVLTKFKNPSAASGHEAVTRDLSDAATIEEFIERLEFVTVPPRPEVTAAEAEAEETQAETPAAALLQGGRGAMLPSVPQEVAAAFAPAEFNHSKTGAPIFAVRITRRLDSEEYRQAAAGAKKLGGYYSSYARDGAIPGFLFKSAEARDAFIGADSAGGQALMSSASQRSFDFGATGSFDTKKGQRGFDFSEPADSTPTRQAAPVTAPAPAAQGALDLGVSVSSKDQGGFDFDAPAAPKAPASPKTVSAPPAAPSKIEDFGEKILGARKDTWGKFKTAIEQALPEDGADITVAKYLPEPDYEAAKAAGISEDSLATYKALRDSIPAKPRQPYKLRRWVDTVRALHPIMQQLVQGDTLTPAEFAAMEKAMYRGGDLAEKINLYRDLGYPAFTKADDWKIIDGVAKFYRGNVKLGEAERVMAALFKGRFVDGLESTDLDRTGYIEIIGKIRARILAELQAPTKKEKKAIEFSILQDRLTRDVFIGKKAVNGWVRMKTGFATPKEAREYIADHQQELEEQWEGMKKPVDYRKQVNAPRQGPERRPGDVTPEMFADAFGFRGVQFGNWVEENRRQVDINEAFDAFMDMAEALGIPPKAVSLDGSLGLAFGARGIPNAKAHYEPDFVIINLSKKSGPGSLGHEWFHAFDNYFARLDQTGETKARALDKFATNYSSAPKNMRPEVWEAFKRIRQTLETGPFADRSRKLDDAKGKPYYSQMIEKAARAFERYTVDRLEKTEISNDFLVNLTKDSSPALPTQPEMDAGIRQAYDNLFNVLDTKETDRGMALFSSRTQPDLFDAAKAPDAAAKLGQVKIGTKNALGAYRALTAKRDAGKTLTPDEEQTLLDAETALGQKMAFDMGELARPAPAADDLFATPATPKPPTKKPKDIQQSMSFGGEVLKDGQITLFSSATDTQAAVEAALEKMPPIYREVFQRVSNGASEADVMLRLNLSENAITNILNAVRSRIVVATQAAAGKLQPAMRDGKFDGGRPDLAEGAQPDFVAIDQVRNESGVVPGTYVRSERQEEAIRRLDADYEGEFARLEKMAKDGVAPEDLDVFMEKEIFRRETMSGGLDDPARRVKVALFRIAFRDQGSAQSYAFSARIDENLTPAERNALHFTELLYEPSPEVQKRMKKADPATKESILKKWMQQIDAFKAEMLAQGIDIEATLRQFNEREQARKQALDESPRAKAAMEKTFARMTKRQKMVVQMILNGAKLDAVIAATGMTREEIINIHREFEAGWRATMAEAAKAYMEGRLAASPGLDVMGQIMAGFGWQSLDDFDTLAPDYTEKQELKKKEAEALAQARREVKKKKPKELPRFGTSEQEARWKELAEKWRNSPMSTWRTLWETVMNDLGPIFGTSFEKARDEFIAPWRALWQTEMNLRPKEGRMTFEEWMEKPETRDKWKKQPELFAEPVNETTGPNEKKAAVGQGSLGLEGVNETTGTFDLNDPRPMSYLANEWARRNGTWINKAIEWFKMSILSGLQTIAINAMGGMHVAYTVGPRRAMEATWNDLLGLFGAGDVRSATLTEFLPMVKNVRASMRLAAKQGIRAWQLESPVFESFAEGKPIQLEFSGVGPEFAPPALSVATWKELTSDPSFKNAIGFVNRFMRNITFRELTATDEFWKGMYAQLDVAAIAHRIAAKEEKLTGEAYAKRTAELMKPGSVAWSRAVPRTKSATFQDPLAYGKWTKEDEKKNPNHRAGTEMSWRQAFEKSETESAWTMLDAFAQLAMDARHMPLIGPILHMFALPFIITPKNLIQRGLEVTPLGLVVDLIDGMRSFRRRIHSGKITAEESRRIAGELYNKARFIQLLTNQSIGMMAYMVLEEMSEGDDDDESGRPFVTGTMPWTSTKQGERANAEEVMPPQSFRIGNTIIPYKRFDPFSTIIASLVDMGNSVHRNGGKFNSQVVTDSLVSLKEQTKDKLFLKGLGDLLKVAEDPRRGADRLAAGYVTGFVPNLIRQPVRETDTVTRDKNPMADAGFFQAVGQRVGYDLFPRSAPPKIDIWGDPIPANRGELLGGSKLLDAAFRILDPTNTTFGGKVRPISAWIYRFNMLQPDSSQRIGIEPYNDEITVTFPGEEKPRKIALTPAEVQEANQNIGRSALALLGEEWDWRTAGTQEALQQAERIKDVFTSLKRNETQRIKLRKLTEAIPAP